MITGLMVSNLKQYGTLLSYYLGTRLGSKKPILGGMKLTRQCNLRCRHCPFWRKPAPSLSFSRAVSCMEALRAWGVRILILEGGEPFLWRDGDAGLEAVVGKAKKLFSCVGVTTNGTFPIEVDADVVWVSIDGLQETHDAIRGQSFTTAMTNIAASSHPNIYAHITINSLNWKEIPELVESLSARVKGITIQFHYPYPGVEESLLLPLAQRRTVLDRLIELKKAGLPVADSCACLEALKDNTWKCHPWMIASVDSDGILTRGCYVKRRGEISCERCGFAAHTELSLAYGGVLEAIRAGNRIFSRPGRASSHA